MHATIFSATTIGVDAHIVHVEVDVSFGLINFFIVGLPDTAIKESTKRIQTALNNSGIRLPAKRITVNLAPADLKKVGTLFDLPIAIGILMATEYIALSADFINETLFLGELSLDGSIRAIKGALAIACDAKKLNKKRIILPQANAAEAALIEGLEIIGVHHITHLVSYLRAEQIIQPTPQSSISTYQKIEHEIDFAQVRGQESAKRALQIAAAGRHNILFIGSPGAGKTMLAKRLSTIMPAMTLDEIIQTSKIYSISGKLHDTPLIISRPFRNPHHTISHAGLIGGGSFPQPGEISLAHHGILFLDELTEFKRDVLESLRQPIENKEVCIARAQQSINFPADCMLVVALNPCPCGFFGDKKRTCICTKAHITKYLQKLSGPLLDRIDIQVHVPSLDYSSLKEEKQTTTSQELSAVVAQAYALQRQRNQPTTLHNSTLTPDQIAAYCQLSSDAEQLLQKAFDRLRLSMRGYHKIIKVARTIADLANSSIIDIVHMQEALTYRSLDQFLDTHRT